MELDKRVFDRALGGDEPPPMQLDFDRIEDAARRDTRRRVLPLVGAGAAVTVVLAGAVFFSVHDSGPMEVTPAVPVAGSGTTKAAIRTESPTIRDTAYCYKSASITSTETNQHVPAGLAAASGRGDAAGHILEMCGIGWKENAYAWQPLKPPGQVYDVPPLVACVLNSSAVQAQSGAVGVFPGNQQTCADMGLAVAQP
ncbi:hypothetical protein GCM10010174_47370 [Kutzneria viridogrisea]|uniref:Uncharacterized protein n=2 Tax=Kutzneria TaxID=43356 RepID=W5WE50_9PSEU|nr:hypothetical protein [Kutzneria albida]AHH98861.1 hypothetical protein KALB_5499 [Kutzneria albida DSM 43870]MBA8923585.1 hypothetical protein [Kutzneria viridogrisea]